MSRKKVNQLKTLLDTRAQKLLYKEESGDLYVSTEYIRTIDKGYRFLQDGHVHDIKYHSMDHKSDYICIVSQLLPSVKDCVYIVSISI